MRNGHGTGRIDVDPGRRDRWPGSRTAIERGQGVVTNHQRDAANGLGNYFRATAERTRVMARACVHDDLGTLERRDSTTRKRDVASPTDVEQVGVEWAV